MYRLYKKYDMIPKLLGVEYFEKDIVDTLISEYKEDNKSKYVIIRDIGNGDEFYKTIKNETDYHNYIAEYQNKMLQELDVIELKREIVDRAFVKKKKK